MAIAAPTSPFVWGAGGSQKTPEQIAREREIAAALMNEGMDYSPVGHWLQGAARVAQGGVGALKDRWANEAETAGREGFQSKWDSVFGGQAAPVQTAAIDPVAAALTGAPQTASDATAALATGASPLASFLGAGKDPAHVDGLSADFSSPLARFLADAPGGGITINSGYRSPERQEQLWQEALVKYGSPEAARKWVAPPGRSNHNHGTAADLAYASDEARAWAHENAAKYGLNFRMGHEPWHVELASGAQGAAVPTGGGSQSPLQMAQAPDMAALLGLASDPWANDAQRSIVESLMGQQMQQQDPRYQIDMQLKQAQLQQALTPEAPKPIEVGGVLLDPTTYQPIFDSRQPSENGFTLSPGQQRFDAQGNPIASAPDVADPNKAPTVTKVTLDDGSEMAVQWDGASQKWVPINAPEGGGTLQPDGLTESQAKLTLFQTLQTETQPVLLDLETQFDPSNIQDATARSTPIAGNFFQSEQGQIYNTAAKAWAEGALRIATGAAATPDEMQRTIGTYFAQPGDTPNTIAFKAQMREMYNRAINSSLGQRTEGSLPLPSDFAKQVGTPSKPQANPAVFPSAGTVEDGYRFKGGDPADPNNWEQVQ